MAQGVTKWQLMTLSAAVGSASVTFARSYQTVYLQVPTMASGTNFDVAVNVGADANFYPLRKEAPNTTTAQNWTFVVAATCMANGAMVPLPGGFPSYKIIATDSAPTATGSFYFVCFD